MVSSLGAAKQRPTPMCKFFNLLESLKKKDVPYDKESQGMEKQTAFLTESFKGTYTEWEGLWSF